jgi:apolipoprotein N-acyltransferase
MIGLVSENIRGFLLGLLATCTTVVIQVGGILLALAHPPLAMALAMLLFVSLLYHSVTSPRLEIA